MIYLYASGDYGEGPREHSENTTAHCMDFAVTACESASYVPIARKKVRVSNSKSFKTTAIELDAVAVQSLAFQPDE